MSILGVRIARVRRLSRSWLDAVRRGNDNRGQGLERRLSTSIGKLDVLAGNSTRARDEIVQVHIELQGILEEVELLKENARQQSVRA